MLNWLAGIKVSGNSESRVRDVRDAEFRTSLLPHPRVSAPALNNINHHVYR